MGLFFSFRYRERIVWTDKALFMKLMRKGILTRIYAPMVSSHAWNLLSGFSPTNLPSYLLHSYLKTFITFPTKIYLCRLLFKVWRNLVFLALWLQKLLKQSYPKTIFYNLLRVAILPGIPDQKLYLLEKLMLVDYPKQLQEEFWKL